ncbi:MAG: sigma-70 family RNA polymerase sigma factor [Bacteroidales bacterium]|nr:sigma-70 family RNA polymerase sigma factor [Bacteroidales bacterium]
MNSNTYTENQVIEGLRSRDPIITKYFVRQNKPYVKALVFFTGSNGSIPEDLFNDGMIVLFRKLDNPDFIFGSTLNTFFFNICKLLIMHDKVRAMSMKLPELDLFDEEERPCDPAFDEEVDRKLLLALIRKHLLRMRRICKRILNLHFLSLTIPEIAARLKKSCDSTRKLKSRCRKSFLNAIKSDPDYKYLKPETLYEKEKNEV